MKKKRQAKAEGEKKNTKSHFMNYEESHLGQWLVLRRKHETEILPRM